jgi:AcrR family transcriptional regulator
MVVVKDDIRDQIVDTARGIFTRFGFRKTTMDEIARAMRKGKSSIYYYFTSKEEIFKAVVDKESQTLREEIISSVNRTTDPREKLRNYVLTRMKVMKNVANFYDALKNEYLSHLEFVNKVREKYDKQEIKIVKDILEEGADRKVFRIEDPELAAIAIVTALKGLEIPLFWSKASKNLEKRTDDLLSVLFNGILMK